MVMMFMIGVGKLLIVLGLLYFPFKIIEDYYHPTQMNTKYKDDIHLYQDGGNDGFFMAAMYQDMGNDL
tara:strand:- start:1099 stop:1302 length:204 start_codon:yes stop_codon:yes gene_type:complete